MADIFKNIQDTNQVSDIISANILKRAAKRKDKTRPLVVMLGENHHQANHAASNFRIIETLQQHIAPYAINYGYEVPHTSSLHALRRILSFRSTNDNLKASLESALGSLDSSNSYHAWLSIAADPRNGMPLIDQVLTYRLLSAGSPMIYGDLPTVEPSEDLGLEGLGFLDENDGVFKKCLSYFRNKPKGTDAISPASYLGVHLRNLAMRDRAAECIDLNKPEIFIQVCGNFHVGGNVIFPDSISLSTLFQRAGFETYGVIRPTSESLNDYFSSAKNVDRFLLDGPKFYACKDSLESDWLKAVMPQVSKVGWREDEIDRVKQVFYQQVERICLRLSSHQPG